MEHISKRIHKCCQRNCITVVADINNIFYKMKREIIVEIKDDLNHYALIKQKNNRENETDYGMLIDKDQFEQLRLYFVSCQREQCDHDFEPYYNWCSELAGYRCEKCGEEKD